MRLRVRNKALCRPTSATGACQKKGLQTQGTGNRKKLLKYTRGTIPSGDNPNTPNICRTLPRLNPNFHLHGEALTHRDYHIIHALSPHVKVPES